MHPVICGLTNGVTCIPRYLVLRSWAPGRALGHLERRISPWNLVLNVDLLVYTIISFICHLCTFIIHESIRTPTIENFNIHTVCVV